MCSSEYMASYFLSLKCGGNTLLIDLIQLLTFLELYNLLSLLKMYLFFGCNFFHCFNTLINDSDLVISVLVLSCT